MDVYLIEPTRAPEWQPFADCRPLAEMRAGIWLIRERWEAVAGGDTPAIFGPAHLHGFVEHEAPSVEAARPVDGPALIGHSTFAPSGVRPEFPRDPRRLVNEGYHVGWWVPKGSRWDPQAGFPQAPDLELAGIPLHGAFDLITALEHLLVADAADFTHEGGDELPEGSIVIGDPADVVLLGAVVEPGVVFDVRDGAVVVEEKAHVRTGTRLEGPVYVGPTSEVFGGHIKNCVFGARCKVRGEMQSSVMVSYANKVHDGFIGHSVVGPWVNIGAGTTTSNLKNTYGPVRLTVAGERIETERQLLGTLFGDHAKVAIGTFLNTGTVIGAGANVFGPGTPPKHVPPFAWGSGGEVLQREGFLAIAERVMLRRQVEFTDAVRAYLSRIYDAATR